MKIEGCRRKEDGVVEEGWPGESGRGREITSSGIVCRAGGLQAPN